MMADDRYADLEALFSAPLPEDDVELSGGRVVRVRGMTRSEVLKVRSQVKDVADAIKRQAEFERRLIAMAMVNPPMTTADVQRWQDASAAGEIERVTNRVEVLSGLKDDAVKEAVKEFEADPDAEFPVPPR
jgi:hypothetical protein